MNSCTIAGVPRTTNVNAATGPYTQRLCEVRMIASGTDRQSPNNTDAAVRNTEIKIPLPYKGRFSRITSQLIMRLYENFALTTPAEYFFSSRRNNSMDTVVMARYTSAVTR